MFVYSFSRTSAQSRLVTGKSASICFLVILNENCYSSTRRTCFCLRVLYINGFLSSSQIRAIRRSLTRPVLLSLIISLVMSRLDYGNAMLAGSPSYMFDKLQSVLNAAARLIFSKRRFESVTPLLRDLHWLRVPQCVEYKLPVIVYHCLHNLAPEYLCDEL